MVKNYFLEKSFVDAVETVKGAFRKNGEVIAQYKSKLKESKCEKADNSAMQDAAMQDATEGQESSESSDTQNDNQVKGIFDGITIAAVAVVGNISVLCCAGLHFLILGFIALGLYITMGFLRLVDMIQKAAGKKQCCSGCGAPIQESICLCPRCGAQHNDLVSDSYGVLHKTCSCGEKLPVSSLNGRSSLTRVCPGCGMIIPPKKTNQEGTAQVEV